LNPAELATVQAGLADGASGAKVERRPTAEDP
jgi:hypothetical protein